MTESLRDVWEHLVSHQVTRDIDRWLACFSDDAVMEWPFRMKGIPERLEGRDAIRAAVAPVWERAKNGTRQIIGHDRVAFHQTSDPEVAIVEFDIVGASPRGPFRQTVVYQLRIRDGRVLLLREFVDTAALTELFQAGS